MRLEIQHKRNNCGLWHLVATDCEFVRSFWTGMELVRWVQTTTMFDRDEMEENFISPTWEESDTISEETIRILEAKQNLDSRIDYEKMPKIPEIHNDNPNKGLTFWYKCQNHNRGLNQEVSESRRYSLAGNLADFFRHNPKLSEMAKDLFVALADIISVETKAKEENRRTEIVHLLNKVCGILPADIADFERTVMVGVVRTEKKIRQKLNFTPELLKGIMQHNIRFGSP
jgi:hypothetical protein